MVAVSPLVEDEPLTITDVAKQITKNTSVRTFLQCIQYITVIYCLKIDMTHQQKCFCMSYTTVASVNLKIIVHSL